MAEEFYAYRNVDGVIAIFKIGDRNYDDGSFSDGDVYRTEYCNVRDWAKPLPKEKVGIGMINPSLKAGNKWVGRHFAFSSGG